MALRILAFAGSARRDSLNKRLIRVAARTGHEGDVEITLIDLDDFSMPVYHGDLDAAEGLPPAAQKLREIFLAHDAASSSPRPRTTLRWRPC